MSFLSRLSRLGAEAKTDRIIRNLSRIFNSRKEYGSVVKGFGIGDYEATWNTSLLMETLMDEMLDAVRDFEPELLEPAVEVQGRDHQLWVRFLLSGLVDDVPRAFHIDIDSKYRNVVVALAPEPDPAEVE